MFKISGRGNGRRILIAGVALACLLVLPHLAMAADEASKAAARPNIFFQVLDWTVMLTLLAGSVAGVALIIDAVIHVKESRVAPVESTEHIRSLINSRQYKELMDFTLADQSFVSQALNSGLRRAHLGATHMREAMESSASDQTSNLFRRIEMLNVIGNIGPLVGLLGTVLGMIMAFQALKDAGGTPNVGQLSGGISAALFHTFGGLAVAIPCLVVFGFYRTKVDKITAKATILTEELLESLLPAEKGSAAAAGIGGSAAAAAPARPAPRHVASPTENA